MVHYLKLNYNNFITTIITDHPSHPQGHENLPVVPRGEPGGREQVAEGAESKGQGRPTEWGTGQEIR